MKNFRSLIDITPWDKSGYSFWGLNRKQAKILGLFFIILGLALADPPFSIIPSDVINLWLGGVLAGMFGISFELGILLTYTLIAWGLIFIGIYIYPYDSERLLSGIINKIKRGISAAFKQPLIMGAGIVIFYFIFQWYKGVINTHVDASQQLFDSLILTNPSEYTFLLVFGIVLVILIIRSKR